LDSGINFNCFLSIIGTVVHEEIPNDRQPHPRACKKNLLCIYLIYLNLLIIDIKNDVILE